MKFIYLMGLCVGGLFFVSCEQNESSPEGDFQQGVFIINEGAFGAGDGSISFFSQKDQTVTEDIFGLVNNGLALGDVVQSMAIVGNEAYIVVNNDNKVEISTVNTFQSIHTIRDVSLPRYFTSTNGKGYLTEWVSFEDPGRVSVIDLTTHEVTKTITTGFGSENLLVVGNKLFVSNNFTNTVSVINTTTDAVINTITVASAPGEFVVDAQNKIWVICGGEFQANNGQLIQIDPDTEEVVKKIELLRNVPVKVAIDKTRNYLFFFSGKEVFKVATTAEVVPSQALLTESEAIGFYGLGIDHSSNVVYVGDAKGFTSAGVVFRYTIDGAFIDSFQAGRGPNGFVFK